MEKELFREETIYSVGDSKLVENSYEVIKNTVRNNHAVGFVTGHYDEELSISNVSGFLLHNLGYDYEEFMEATNGSLKNLFYGDSKNFLDLEHFQHMQGEGEGMILTKGKMPVYVRLFKKDSIDKNGDNIWILSARMDWMQQNLQLVNNVIQSGFWVIDCDKDGEAASVSYSNEFRKMIGCHDTFDFPNTLEAWSDRLHPEDRENAEKQLEAALLDRTNQTKYNVEYRMKMADGTYQWFRDSAEVTRRLDGSACRMAGIFINIEKEKETKRQEQRSNAFHRAYTEGNLCEYYVDLKKNKFDSLKNEDSLFKDFEKEHTWDELIQYYLKYFVCVEDKKAISMLYDRDYILQRFSEGSNEISLECKIMINGEIHWVRNVILADETQSRSRYAMVFVRDITDAKAEAENVQELTQQNQAMDMLIQGTIKLVDRYAMCDLKNNTYHYFNRDPENIVYKPTGSYDEFVDAMECQFKLLANDISFRQAFSKEHIREMLKTPDDIYKFEYCTKGESQFKTIAICPLSWEDGKVARVLFISQDITQEKIVEIQSRDALKEAYEAADKASRAKTEFLSNMSHDIRTPMNAIVGMTAIAGANIENQDRVLDCLSKITQSSRHLLSLINEVLDMSRIESGKIALSEEEFNLSDLVDNLVAMARSGIELHQHDFEVHLSKIEHEDVAGDSLRIQQLITNIMSNAIKYTPDGGKIIFGLSEIETTSADLGCYKFTIEDNGIGMSEEFQKIIFEPFTRADDKRTSKIQGTGLGMAIAKNIASMMNGSIKVESELGKGSKFTITIFLKLQHKELKKIDEFINLPVLVVDDDKMCCENTVDILKDIGIDGEWVTSGKEAVDKVAKRYQKDENYFAIIIDWQMPEMDGIETTRQIRKQVGNDVTIIILSAYDYSEIEAEAREAGVDDFIAKPLFRSRLTATLKNIIEGKPNKEAKNYLSNISNCDFNGKRVLLVEDNQLNSEIASEIIAMTGADIETAENGKEAVDKFANAPVGFYDLVFMDIQMPTMNGYEATAAIRSLGKYRAKEVPIIAMTANAFAEDVVMAKNAGMDEHIAKPLEMNRLCEIMQRYL